MVEHFTVKFGDPSCLGFWDIVPKPDKQTDKRRWKPYPRDYRHVGVDNQVYLECNFFVLGRRRLSVSAANNSYFGIDAYFWCIAVTLHNEWTRKDRSRHEKPDDVMARINGIMTDGKVSITQRVDVTRQTSMRGARINTRRRMKTKPCSTPSAVWPTGNSTDVRNATTWD